LARQRRKLLGGQSGNADDFESTGYLRDDLASVTHRHTGSGDLHARGQRAAPVQQSILDALTNGTPRPIDGQNAVRHVLGRVEVIVGRDVPWQSVGHYRGG